MAVPTQTNWIAYDGNNSTVTAYPIPFPFFESADLRVSTLAEDADDMVVLESPAYTVTRLANGSGGSLVTASAVPASSTLKIERLLRLTQPTVFPLAGPLPASSIETGLDRLTMMVQQLATAIAALAADGDGSTVILSPPPTSGDEDEITLNPATLNLDEGANVRVTATFSGAGAFADAFLRTHMFCDLANAVITPEQNKCAVGRASWVVFLKPLTNPYGLAMPCVFTATIRGKQWNGASSSNILATWTVEQLS